MPDRTTASVKAGPPAEGTSSSPFAGLLRVSGLTFASRVLGLIRDMAMAAVFGNGAELDAFTVAFRLPNFTRRLFGEAAFSTAFLPVFIRELHAAGQNAGWRLATAVLVITAAAVSAVTIVAEIILLTGYFLVGAGETRLLLGLTAILFPYQIFVCVVAQASAVLHAFGRFSLPAMLPIVANLLWVGTLAFAVEAFSSDVTRVYVVSGGIVLSGISQLALTLPTLRALGFRFQWDWPSVRLRVREIAIALLPVLAGLSVMEFNSLIDGFVAWLLTAPADGSSSHGFRYPLEEGAAAALYLGQRLYQFPLGVFGVALGTILFPRLARHAAAGRRANLADDLTLGLRLSIAVGLPASVGLVLIARPLVDALFRYGAFDAADANQTAAAIAGYGVGVWAYIAMLIANRGFYAVGDRTTPIKTGVAATLAHVALGLWLVWPIGEAGLALGTAVATALQVALSIIALRMRGLTSGEGRLAKTTLKAIVATAVMTPACILLRDLTADQRDLASRVLGLAAPVGGSIIVYLAVAWSIGLRELELLTGRTMPHGGIGD